MIPLKSVNKYNSRVLLFQAEKLTIFIVFADIFIENGFNALAAIRFRRRTPAALAADFPVCPRPSLRDSARLICKTGLT
jgi:hypothetical protein